MTPQKLKLLIVEDEEAIRTGLADVFIFHGYDVVLAQDGRQARELLKERYDLIILDVMLPHVDGFTLCNEIRETDREQPIIMLTAKSNDEDIINGFTLGADDYITKPFSIQELVLRVEAVLRRSARLKRKEQILTIGDLKIDAITLTAKSSEKDTEQLFFTRREIEILQYLLNHSERPVSRGELLEEVWGYRRASAVDTRTVDIHIAKLRRKIEPNHKNPTLLVTVRGEGYQLKKSE